jgi:hypothetical protein
LIPSAVIAVMAVIFARLWEEMIKIERYLYRERLEETAETVETALLSWAQTGSPRLWTAAMASFSKSTDGAGNENV